MKNFVDALQQLTNPEMIFKVPNEKKNQKKKHKQFQHLDPLISVFLVFVQSTQDWWDSVKNALDKPEFNKKRMSDMFEEMYASLGDGDSRVHGTFRKKFIKVWGIFQIVQWASYLKGSFAIFNFFWSLSGIC